MNEMDKMDTFLIILSAGVILFIATKMFLKLIRGIRSNEYVDNQIIKFKKDSIIGKLGTIVIFGVQLYIRYDMDKTIYEFEKGDMKVKNFTDFVFKLDTAPMIIYVFSVLIILISIIDIVIGMLFKIGIFDDGIIVAEGTFIPWKSIEKLKVEDSMSDEYKVLIIHTDKTEIKRIFNSPYRAKVNISDFKKSVDIVAKEIKSTK